MMKFGRFEEMNIDLTYDFRADSGGKDPDAYSATLRRYHQLLWSKPLPSGASFNLLDNVPGAYLLHRSDLGEFILASDSIVPTFSKWTRLKNILEQIPPNETETFRSLSYTMGGMLIFPGNRIDGKPTINGARGFNQQISDRFDLTLECIRRFYLGLDSPLSQTLSRYPEFFKLFEDFQGYVEFFLLEDLIADDLKLKFFMPFNDFQKPTYPKDLKTYLEYRNRSIEFIKARNNRIQQLSI